MGGRLADIAALVLLRVQPADLIDRPSLLDQDAPLAESHPHIDRRRLAVAIRAGCGIEAWVWMVDIAAVSRTEAATLMRESARALLAAALAQPSQR